VHANDSRDPFGSGADRHANLTTGQIEVDAIVAVCAAAGAPIIVETRTGPRARAPTSPCCAPACRRDGWPPRMTGHTGDDTPANHPGPPAPAAGRPQGRRPPPSQPARQIQ